MTCRRPGSPSVIWSHRVHPRPPLDRDTGLRRPWLPDALARRHRLPRPLLPGPALAAHLGLRPVRGGGPGRGVPGGPHRRLRAALADVCGAITGAPAHAVPPPFRSAEEGTGRDGSSTPTATSACSRRTPSTAARRSVPTSPRAPPSGELVADLDAEGTERALVMPNYGVPDPRSRSPSTSWSSRRPQADDRIRAGLWVSPAPAGRASSPRAPSRWPASRAYGR